MTEFKLGRGCDEGLQSQRNVSVLKFKALLSHGRCVARIAYDILSNVMVTVHSVNTYLL